MSICFLNGQDLVSLRKQCTSRAVDRTVSNMWAICQRCVPGNGVLPKKCQITLIAGLLVIFDCPECVGWLI